MKEFLTEDNKTKERKVIISYGTRLLKDIMKEILMIKMRNT